MFKGGELALLSVPLVAGFRECFGKAGNDRLRMEKAKFAVELDGWADFFQDLWKKFLLEAEGQVLWIKRIHG